MTDTDNPETVGVDDQTLEALYNLNKHAKKYAGLADENYQKGKKATARKNSVRKQALYDLKTDLLVTLIKQGPPDHVERHSINGRDYFCIHIAGWSFHTPVDEWSGPSLDVESVERLDDFETDSEKELSDMSLKASLLHIEQRFGLSANDYLEDEYIRYGSSRYFAGWSYLGE